MALSRDSFTRAAMVGSMAVTAAFMLTFSSVASARRAPNAAEDYRDKCQTCHGADGKANTKVGNAEKIPSFTDPSWQKRKSDSDIREVITNGSKQNAKMKAFQDKLTPQQISDLVKYVRSFR